MKSRRPSRPSALLLAALASAGPLAACASTTPAAETGAIAVTSSDDACEVAASQAPPGVVRFTVENTGSQVTEFYVLAADGLRVVGEVENIGPGVTRDLVVQAAPGTYQLACKPGMVGDGIRSAFTVADSDTTVLPTGSADALMTAATIAYASYVRDSAEQLLSGTTEFAAAYRAGDEGRARELYAPTRMHWERIEPVAESFGDLDPRMDAREADLEAGQTWTGWHRIEKDLWPPETGYTPLPAGERSALADLLVADTRALHDRSRDLTFTAAQMGNGAKELLDEVATGKITGEEEIWSHTDLWDFQANLDGAKAAYANLKQVVEQKDPRLARTLDTAFAAVQALLDGHRVGEGWALYTDLTTAEIKELAAAVDALGEPLSRLTSTVLL